MSHQGLQSPFTFCNKCNANGGSAGFSLGTEISALTCLGQNYSIGHRINYIKESEKWEIQLFHLKPSFNYQHQGGVGRSTRFKIGVRPNQAG